ncbi:colicin V production family protein [Candidatus Endolissoclinum faulkneri L2]|uniref:Colicin V production family protein n=1 Tax=Candidatus Endolissoclinum faulkneri L2 TaxID=1193729 RepID=K7ZD65_9PROT|nr:CvpA family protein [Candidatus Endolissoclinum faulkneri]AFX99236.1 colicin V production family protein [Candidatus Endolissoclinum faulkneri L2]
MKINIIDIIIITFIIFSSLPAFIKGFISEIFSIFAWISALLVGIYSYKLITIYLAKFMGTDFSVKILIASGVLFVLSLILFLNMGQLALRMMPMIKYDSVNRALGFIFGIVRGLIIVGFAYLLLSWIEPNPDNYPKYLKEAKLLPMIVKGTNQLLTLVPKCLDTKLVENPNT